MADVGRPYFEFGPFRLDVSEHMLLRDGHPVPLTPKNLAVLSVLVQNAGHLVDKERLLKEAWPDSFVEEGTLNRSVSVLRKALGDSPAGHRYIVTVPTRGYRFVAPVAECFHADSKSPTQLQSGPAIATEAAPSNLRSILSKKRMVGVAAAILIVGAIRYAVVGPGTEPTTNAAATAAPVHTGVTFTGKDSNPTISPDGRRIAYLSAGKPEKRLMVQELAGGQPLAVFSAPEVGHVRWSPDGSELLFWTRGAGRNGLYIMPQLGGMLRSIAPGQYIGCWSPDGSTIAVASYMGAKIWLLNTLGRVERTVSLREVDSSISDIDWSVANRLLTFVTNDSERHHTIWTIRSDGSDQKQVVTESGEISSARWAPHGEAIYFSRRLNQTFSLFKVPVQRGDESGEAVVATLITGLEAEPPFAPSADGTRLVYTRASYHSNLWLLEVGGDNGQGSAPKELTRGTSLIERPSISPDGQSVVFNIGHEGRANLYVMPITGGPPRQLTFFDSHNVGGVWSPDGKRIAFASTEGGRTQVWTVDAVGGVPRPLASTDMSDTYELAWSPATQILYQQPGYRNYREFDPQTRVERPLVRRPRGWIYSPVHSLDRQKIAVFWNRPPNRGFWIIDVDDRAETLVYPTDAGSARPLGWSPDGHSIYVIEGKNWAYRGLTAALGESMTDARILLVPLDGGEVHTVANLPFEEIGGVAMASDGRRFVVTVYSSRSDVWMVDNFDGASPSKASRESASRD